MSQSPVAAVVLAAGQSTRMRSDAPKVLHEVCGRPMLAFVLDACRAAGIERVFVVVGHQKQLVINSFASDADLAFVEQAEQKGTGHAVLMCRQALERFDGPVLVIAGDMPLIRGETLSELAASHRAAGAAASLATTVLDDPGGYGRIVRDEAGALLAIVEERDCTPDQRAIREVNPSYYCFDRAGLFEALGAVRPDNAKKELYLTDVFRELRQRGRTVAARTVVPAADATGINSRADLAEVNRLMQRRLQEAVFEGGATIVSPETTWIEAGATVGAETVIQPFTFVGAWARVGRGCALGPFAWVARRETVPDGATVAGNLGPVERAAAVLAMHRPTVAVAGGR